MSIELIIQALEEFIEKRTPIVEYVARQYVPDNESFRVAQIQRVTVDIATAEDLIRRFDALDREVFE
jgi:hypothetical protein